MAAEPEPRHRNDQLVAQIEESGALRDPDVAAAFRAVLRHHFLPGRPLGEVYEDAAITTRTGEDGAAISSSSQPAIMAIMLQLLRLRPGHRVLEVGAGTGYNAALLAHLVGPGGRVVTLDIDRDVVVAARANLEAAGVPGVEVVEADGDGGWPAAAPYDRIVVTAGADDLSPAWPAQLVEDGRLVVPLALAGPGQQCVAFVRRGRVLDSEALCPCGFMPLRGGAAPASPPADRELATWLAETGRPAGHAIDAADLRAGFELWLALTEDGYVAAGGERDDPRGFGLRDAAGVALVGSDGGAERPVVVHGHGEAAAARLARAHRAWARRRPSLERIRVAAVPVGVEPGPGEGGRTLRRPRFTFVVRGA